MIDRIQLNAIQSFKNIAAYRLRSCLATLGVLVGTASVVTLMSTSQLATEHALSMFKGLGTHLIAMQVSQGFKTKNSRPFDAHAFFKMKVSIPDIIKASPYKTTYGKISYKDTTIDAQLIASTPELAQTLNIHTQSGRFISQMDNYPVYAVAGKDLAQQLSPLNLSKLIGQQVLFHGNYVTVVGILKNWTKNLFFYSEINKSLIIPIQSSDLIFKDSSVQNALFFIKPNTDINQLQQKIQTYLKREYPGLKVFFQNPNQIIHVIKKSRQSLTLLLLFIGLIALLVGAIGIMNIMLVSVVERRQEIGIRLAIGAKQRDILTMFLTESVILTSLGGSLGIVTGSIITFGVGHFSGWGYHIIWPPIALGVGISIISGLVSGIYPAYRASQLNPISILN